MAHISMASILEVNFDPQFEKDVRQWNMVILEDMMSHSRLRIAQIAPIEEAVPPVLYGGIERVVSALTEQLVRQGHDVVLFASGDSHTAADLIPLCSKAVRLNRLGIGTADAALDVLWQHRSLLESFDIVHFHTEVLRFPMFRKIRGRYLMTVHMQPNWIATRDLLRACPTVPYVAISQTQRDTVLGVNWIATVRHGLSPNQFPLVTTPNSNYLAFLGRVSPEKGLLHAIEIARRAGMPLKIAAKVGDDESEYFCRCIEPLVDGKNIEFCGEISDAQKAAFLGHAAAMLFPISQPEPFGLCLIEAMACGAPVIGFSVGTVPEIVENGVTGFAVRNVEEAVAAVHNLRTLDREIIRNRFTARFSDTRMANEYTALYRSLIREPVACVEHA